MGARLLAVRGRVQREGLVIHVVAEELRDWSELLDGIADAAPLQPPLARADERFSGPGGSWVAVPEARATHVRATAPGIKIASRDFHQSSVLISTQRPLHRLRNAKTPA